MDKTRISRNYFLIGFGLVSLVVYILIVCAVGFIRGYSLSFWQFPLAAVLMLVTQFFAAKHLHGEKPEISFLKNSGLLLGICFISILFANAIDDLSFDGQWYHQETVYQLKKGFNPYVSTLPVPAPEDAYGSRDAWCSGPDRPEKDTDAVRSPVVNLKYLNINHMGKATEIVEAAIYFCTRRIETGKSVNLIMLAGSFFLCLSLLYKIDRLSTTKKWLLAVLACFNPITISQLSSFCVDGLMASLFLCQFVLFCLIFLEDNKYYRFLLGLVIVMSVNIKYTSLVYTAIFCSGFLVLLLLRKKWAATKNAFYICSLSALLGVCFVGFHPYITNLISTNQVFYGLQATQNEIYDVTPSLFRDKNRFEKLFLSLSTHSEDLAANKTSGSEMIKIPFAINKKDLLNANNPELKLSAFGPFFSGALLISVLLLISSAFRSSRDAAFSIAIPALGVILLSVLIIPDPWWARFAPQLWLFPVIILLMYELLTVHRARYLKAALCVAIGLNVVWVLAGIPYNVVITSRVDYQLTRLKTLSQPIGVEFCSYRPFSSNRIRFMENNIPFMEKKVEGKYIYNVIHSNTRFETATELPRLPKPFLVRLNEKIKALGKGKKNK